MAPSCFGCDNVLNIDRQCFPEHVYAFWPSGSRDTITQADGQVETHVLCHKQVSCPFILMLLMRMKAVSLQMCFL